MPSSSSSSSSSTTSTHEVRYDVFLSFRGEDTRDNFTSHLYSALKGKQLLTFIDNNELGRGEEISPTLLKAIQESKISVIVFSPNYASSKWCLQELVKIMDCKKNNGQIVITVFYRVDPSHVRNQTGSFADAFAKHEEVFAREKQGKLQEWKDALKEAANLSGFDSLVTKPETKLINEIVEDILKKLGRKSQTGYSTNLVGIESRVKEVETLLCLESPEVHGVGLWGMGGIGKTTIAEAVFGHIYAQFQGFHFLPNVREELKRDGIVSLWSKLISKLLGEESLNMGTLSLRVNFVKERLRRKKVLIVLDDVDESALEQLKELLAEQHDLFGPGSRILITSRDKQVLKNLVDAVYEVDELNHDEALQLFSLNAFKKRCPPDDYKDLANKVVNYASGNPLAVRVLGSALFDKSKEDWNSALEKLEKVPKSRILNVLRISYDGLSCEEKNIFLDIACFLRWEDRDYATKVLDSFYYCLHFNLSNLIDKSLVTISHYNKLDIHDLLQEMCWNIVREECIGNPGKRSRLWATEDVYDVLTKNKGTEAVEGICLDFSTLREMNLKSDSFKGMNQLRFLKFRRCYFEEKVHLPSCGLEYLSNELKYLHWDGFPLESLPQTFCAENLVELNLGYGRVKRLWNGLQNLVNLKRIDLTWSRYLTEIQSLSTAKNLERIILMGCESLVELPSFIQYLNKLEHLDAALCKNLKSVPRKIDSKVLRVLNLQGCPHVKECPVVSGNVQELWFAWTADKELANSIHKFKALKNLYLSGTHITKFPEISENVEKLGLIGTAIEEVPSWIGFLTRLVSLDLRDNAKLASLPNSICKLKSLNTLDLSNCSRLESFPEILEPMESLSDLRLRNCNILEIRSDLFSLSSLTLLVLQGNNFESLPATIVELHNLRELNLSNCKRLRSIPGLPFSLQYLYAYGCEALETFPSRYKAVRLRKLVLRNCIHLDRKERRKIMSLVLHKSRELLDAPNDPLKELYAFEPGVEILLPGNEIPGWFTYQSRGSSVTIQLPINWHRSVAVAFCIVFAFAKPPTSRLEHFRFRYHFKANNGENHDGQFKAISYFCADNFFKSDHMLLMRYPRDYELPTFAANEASFEFDVGLFKHFKVKRCGFRLLYEEDFCGNPDEYFCELGQDSCGSMSEETNSQAGDDDYCSNDAEPSSGSGRGRGRSDKTERMEFHQDGNSCLLCFEALKELFLGLTGRGRPEIKDSLSISEGVPRSDSLQ